jgi:serpin B
MVWNVRRPLAVICSLALLLVAAACGPQPPPGERIESDRQRVMDPQVPAADWSEQAQGSAALALKMYQQVRGTPGNLFFSPHSVNICMAMLYAGARGDTESQMAGALEFRLPQARLHPFFNRLDLELNSRGRDAKEFRLDILNATFGQAGYTFLAPYLDTLAINYGAGLNLLDFAADPEGSRRQINDWVENRTERRIKDLLPDDAITSFTRLVLANAIFFKAAWLKKFKQDNTVDADFDTGSGTVTVPTMVETMDDASYARDSGYQAAAIPYDGQELSMVIILPDRGTLASFEKALDAAKLAEILGRLQSTAVHLSLPRFKIDYKLELVQVLKALGMVDAFSMKADFSGINGKRDLYVSGAFHKAFIEVDETGTEAAAATAAVVTLKGSVAGETLKADRPFIFLIRDDETGAVLFIGRVVDPSR